MRRRSVIGGWLIAGAVAAFLALPAEAQLQPRRNQNQPGDIPVNVAPPQPGKPDRPPTLWMIVMSALLGAGIVGTALIPSKRGHQD